MKHLGAVWLAQGGNNPILLRGYYPEPSETPIKGVYVIWQSGTPSRVVKVGQADDLELLVYQHSDDNEIMKYDNRDQRLYFTWVTWEKDMSQHTREGVVRYLTDHYDPIIKDPLPDVQPIEVDIPAFCP